MSRGQCSDDTNRVTRQAVTQAQIRPVSATIDGHHWQRFAGASGGCADDATAIRLRKPVIFKVTQDEAWSAPAAVPGCISDCCH